LSAWPWWFRTFRAAEVIGCTPWVLEGFDGSTPARRAGRWTLRFWREKALMAAAAQNKAQETLQKPGGEFAALVKDGAFMAPE
jgi:hypothetical protein